MRFLCLSAVLISYAAQTLAGAPTVLRVCADPNNLPFSNQQGEGFENKLAELVAADLGAKLEYAWWSQRKSFVKNTLDAGRCDVIMGIPALIDSVDATKPYYRSSYVFVSRHDRSLQASSLADPRWSQWKIGVHVVGDDYAPPAAALARQGITKNIISYSLFGEFGEPNPPRKLIDAVANGDIDIAIAWGPLAGYFAKQESAALDIVPVSPPMFLSIPFTYDVSIGVRKGNDELKKELDRVLANNSAAVQQLLARYGIPQVP